MKCYYEELGIPRDANDADIKTAYRKLALRWHPDKNPDAVDEAKERFQLIQQAYEVLSDPQERAWYDNHRDQILRGKNSDYTENCLDVFEYFTSSCFRGYDDDEKGFYAVYREVFKKLAAEDAEFMDDEDDVEEIPTFGDSKSSYEDVVGPFYAYWQSYCTKKTYTWLCPYDVKEIRDRRVLREVEKEMKKLVQKARKERNEEVRNLVSFVRKRDKRVQAYRRLLEERAELNRKKQEQNRLEQIRKRQRELEEMREQSKQNPQHKNDDYEEQLKQLAQDYGDSSAEEDLDDTEDEEADGEENEKNDEAECTEEDFYVDDLYCVVCNKMFKNERAYENHESSKKHRDALERMKLEMQAEEEAFQENNEDEHESEELVDSEAEEAEVKEEIAQSDEHESVAGNTEAHLDDTNADEEELLVGKKAKKNKRARKNAKLNKSQFPATDDDDEHGVEAVAADFLAQAKIADSDEDDWGNSGKKSARKNKNKKQTKKTAKEVEENKTVKAENKVAQTKEEPKAEQQQKATSAKTEEKIVAESTDEDDAIEEVDTVKKSQPKSKPKANESSANSNASNHVCVTCKANFPSKNKLFSHLKITNHGVYIPKASNDTNATSAEGSKGKKGKGKKK